MRGSQDKRVWLGGGAGVAILLVVLSWFFVIDPRLSAASSKRASTTAVQQQNAILEGKLSTLRQQDRQIDKLTSGLQSALNALPFDTGLPEFTRQLNSQAQKAGVGLQSISVGAAKAAITGVASTSGSTQNGESGGVLSIPVTFVSNGKVQPQLDFLQLVQVGGPRRALVLSVQMGQASGNSAKPDSQTMTVLVTIFTTPMSPAAEKQLEKLLHGDISK